jgi:aconitate hydratase
LKGVGGIEAEAVMLGQAISMVLPKVIGYKITGKLNEMCTSTDVVLTITKHLRQFGVVNKFVEFFGPGCAQLSIADRATIANMCPEYGATIGYFAADYKAIEYLLQTGRDPKKVKIIETYLKTVNLYQDYDNANTDPEFTQVVELDLSTVAPCVSGPKRPQDKIVVSELKKEFQNCLVNKIGFAGYGLKDGAEKKQATFTYEGHEYTLSHGSVVIASITSCTNTSNPSVMLAAGLLAKKAFDFGLKIDPYIKTSLSPGSGVVTEYLTKSGMLPCLEKLGFNIVGYGCMTCIGNSGPLPEPIAETIEKNDLVAVGVLSGNRNFEGRIHQSTRANYLASPPLVIVYAIAGRIDIDFETEPLGYSDKAGRNIYLKDIWPTRQEIQELETKYVIPEMFSKVYDKITVGNSQWNSLSVPNSELYPWDSTSTYIKRPPFFEKMTRELTPIQSLVNARALLFLGDSITTDHISPAGSIARNSPAAKFLTAKGLAPREFNSYGSRRGNDEIMTRGTFANIRIVNKLMDAPGPKTIFLPTNQQMDIFDAAQSYKENNIPIILLAGKEYGSGSSRDWAAKGPYILVIILFKLENNKSKI